MKSKKKSKEVLQLEEALKASQAGWGRSSDRVGELYTKQSQLESEIAELKEVIVWQAGQLLDYSKLK